MSKVFFYNTNSICKDMAMPMPMMRCADMANMTDLTHLLPALHLEDIVAI